MSESGNRRRRRNKRNTSESTTSRRTDKCQRPSVSAEEWINSTPRPGHHRGHSRTGAKCQKPGISATEYINNNLGRPCANTSCQREKEKIGLKCPVKVESAVEINTDNSTSLSSSSSTSSSDDVYDYFACKNDVQVRGDSVGRFVAPVVEINTTDSTSSLSSSTGSSDNICDKFITSNREVVQNRSDSCVGEHSDIIAVNKDYKSEIFARAVSEISCLVPAPGVHISGSNGVKDESDPNKEFTVATNSAVTLIGIDVSPICIHGGDVTHQSKPSSSHICTKQGHNTTQLDVPKQAPIMAEMDHRWDGSSVDEGYLSRRQTSAPNLSLNIDGKAEGSSVDKPGQASRHVYSRRHVKKTEPLGTLDIDMQVRASAPDLVSHIPHAAPAPKDVVFLRTHRRTSSLQLARRLSTDLTTIPEELEKRQSSEHSQIDFGSFSRNTLPRGFRPNFSRLEKLHSEADEKIDLSKSSSEICNTICNLWSTCDDTILNPNSKVTEVSPKVPVRPQIPSTKPKGASRSATSNSLRKKVSSDVQVLHNKPIVPSKPKKGDSNFKRFREAGENIKKSVKSRKSRDPIESGSSPQEACKTKQDRNTRRRVFHSKKTRDANAKINIRDTSKESSQEELSKQSEKIPPKSRATRYSKGVELFKSLREKSVDNNNERKPCGDSQCIESSCSSEVQEATTDIAEGKTVPVRDHPDCLKKDKDLDILKARDNCDEDKRDIDVGRKKECGEAIIFQNGFVSEELFCKEDAQQHLSRPRSNALLDVYQLSNTIQTDRNEKYREGPEYLEATTSDDVFESDKSSNSDNDKSSYSSSDKIDDSSDKTDDTSDKTDDTSDDKIYETADDKIYDTADDKTYVSTDKMDESDKTDTTTSDESDTTESSTSSSSSSSSSLSSTSEEKSDTDDKSSVDGTTMELDWRRRAYSRKRDDSEDDREWEARSKRMTANLQWLRTEIAELKKQDQSLMRQFLQLRSTIHAMKRNQGNPAVTNNNTTQSCNFLHFPGNLSASFNDLSQFGSSNSINDALTNINNEMNGNLGSLDGTSGGNEYLPEFRARTVSLINHGSASTRASSEQLFVKPRTMTFSSGSKEATERGVYEPYESGEVAC